jgi:hypothetical protein
MLLLIVNFCGLIVNFCGLQLTRGLTRGNNDRQKLPGRRDACTIMQTWIDLFLQLSATASWVMGRRGPVYRMPHRRNAAGMLCVRWRILVGGLHKDIYS